MSLYTILLVDDEEALALAVMKKINWNELGFSVIGYAENGVKALEMMEEFRPDVVMTDIRMPYMDGIALSRHIRQDFPATKIMFFSGFDEFEYAKEAIHLEIEDYILKPLDAEELTEILAKLKEKLDWEIHEKRNVKLLQEQYLQSLPFLRANFYVSLIEGKIQKEKLEKYLSDYEITLSGPYFCCIVVYTSDRKVLENAGATIEWFVAGDFEEHKDAFLEAQPPVDIVLALDDRSVVRFGEYAVSHPSVQTSVYGIAHSMEAVYYLDEDIVNCLVVPDEFNVGYQSLTKIADQIQKTSVEIPKQAVSYTIIRKETLFTEENQNILFTMGQ